jgi:tetratricopeptide (TPR) repeat protein
MASLDGALRRERLSQVQLPAVLSRAVLAQCLTEVGRVAEGLTISTEALRIAEEVGHSASFIQAYLSVGQLFFRQGDLRQAIPQLERALAISQELDQQRDSPMIACPLGLASTLRLLGDIAAYRDPPDAALAEAHYPQALTLADELGMRPSRPTATWALACCTPS